MKNKVYVSELRDFIRKNRERLQESEADIKVIQAQKVLLNDLEVYIKRIAVGNDE